MIMSNRSKKRISVPSFLLVLINLFFIFLLFLSYLSNHVSPARFWPLAFAGLAYPVILVINFFFVLFWLVFLKKYFLLSFIAILIGFNQITTFINFSKDQSPSDQANELKIMSYNVRLFDLYNWSNSKSKATRESIFSLITDNAPDILCLQEYYNGSEKTTNFADTLSIRGKYSFRSVELIKKNETKLPYGLALFSKFPIIYTQIVEFPNSKVNFCQLADIKIGNDTIRVFNMHLESVKFGKEDYNFVSEIGNSTKKNDELSKASRAILVKMKQAYIRRSVQIETVAEGVRHSPYPVLLTGDFNDTPVSYCYHKLTSVLNDSFVSVGSGIGNTYAFIVPFLRIDYIFYSNQIKVTHLETIKKSYSDHYPIFALFHLNNAQRQ